MLSTEAVQRISAVGILADVGFGCTKLGVGTACASPALVADGAHSLADVLVGAVSYGAYAAARAPPDEEQAGSRHTGPGGSDLIPRGRPIFQFFVFRLGWVRCSRKSYNIAFLDLR